VVVRERPLAYQAFPTAWSADEVLRCYADDPALDRNFFHHPPHRLAKIREALAAKAELTLGQIRPHFRCAHGARSGCQVSGK
jgi:hypothetical protein